MRLLRTLVLYAHFRAKRPLEHNLKYSIYIGLIDTLYRHRFDKLEVSLRISDPDIKGDVFSESEIVS